MENANSSSHSSSDLNLTGSRSRSGTKSQDLPSSFDLLLLKISGKLMRIFRGTKFLNSLNNLFAVLFLYEFLKLPSLLR